MFKNRDHFSALGFTLIELLVVIAILCILTGLVLPAMTGAKIAGQASVCLNSERQMSLACQLYSGDSEDRFPYNLGGAEVKRNVMQGQFTSWTSSIMSWELDSDNTNAPAIRFTD